MTANVKLLVDPINSNCQARHEATSSTVHIHVRQKHTNNKIHLKFRVTIIVVATRSGNLRQRTTTCYVQYIMSSDIRALDRRHLTVHWTNGLTTAGLTLWGAQATGGATPNFLGRPNTFLHLLSLSIPFTFPSPTLSPLRGRPWNTATVWESIVSSPSAAWAGCLQIWQNEISWVFQVFQTVWVVFYRQL